MSLYLLISWKYTKRSVNVAVLHIIVHTKSKVKVKLGTYVIAVLGNGAHLLIQWLTEPVLSVLGLDLLPGDTWQA